MAADRPRVAPFGAWRSPLSAAAVAEGTLRLGAVQLDGADVHWVEGRPADGGRYALVRWRDGRTVDVSPPGFNVRSRVHEYGGGACTVSGGDAFVVEFSDQRLYRLTASGDAEPGRAQALTPAGPWRYADIDVDRRRQRLVCVREDHSAGGEPVNALVSVPLDRGRDANGPMGGAIQVLASGHDFYSTPRLSPDGARLAWLAWRHPAMPWDATELWVAEVDERGALRDAACVAGGDDESIYQPGWSPDGTLYYVSDRSGWWTLYRSKGTSAHAAYERVVENAPDDAEFGRPQWVFGTATWAFAGPSRLVVSYTRRGRWRLGMVDVARGRLTEMAPDLQPSDWLAANATHVVLVAGGERRSDAVVRIDVATGEATRLREASSRAVDAAYLSAAEPYECPTADGRTTHAFYYPPTNPDCVGPPGAAPPLIVVTHGGPTAAARSTLDLGIQYWTSRGFAVADVNYRGSSGYGRAYMRALDGQWGIVDVEDVTSAARYLCDTGRADPSRLIIRGGSAGGYTTLAALTFRAGAFKAGASYYGVSDLEALEIDTHKFESRYTHSLVGPYPAMREEYRARSPIHALDRLTCPIILFQGLEDRIVPPNQSEMMAEAVRAKGIPVAYLAFEGEQHGFRKAETTIRCLEAELYFYGRVFGLSPADPLPPVPVDNLPDRLTAPPSAEAALPIANPQSSIDNG